MYVVLAWFSQRGLAEGAIRAARTASPQPSPNWCPRRTSATSSVARTGASRSCTAA